ncbi:hypothetical protein GCM10009839_74250 [Catenulispora yoronensis]|uniref:Uncharacterized protein n=1 Tax=Catenulispora yoronensis TaxID=450799 RepID=A0ABP5GYT7_9ACTN
MEPGKHQGRLREGGALGKDIETERGGSRGSVAAPLGIGGVALDAPKTVAPPGGTGADRPMLPGPAARSRRPVGHETLQSVWITVPLLDNAATTNPEISARTHKCSIIGAAPGYALAIRRKCAATGRGHR